MLVILGEKELSCIGERGKGLREGYTVCICSNSRFLSCGNHGSHERSINVWGRIPWANIYNDFGRKLRHGRQRTAFRVSAEVYRTRLRNTCTKTNKNMNLGPVHQPYSAEGGDQRRRIPRRCTQTTYFSSLADWCLSFFPFSLFFFFFFFFTSVLWSRVANLCPSIVDSWFRIWVSKVSMCKSDQARTISWPLDPPDDQARYTSSVVIRRRNWCLSLWICVIVTDIYTLVKVYRLILSRGT